MEGEVILEALLIALPGWKLQLPVAVTQPLESRKPLCGCLLGALQQVKGLSAHQLGKWQRAEAGALLLPPSKRRTCCKAPGGHAPALVPRSCLLCPAHFQHAGAYSNPGLVEQFPRGSPLPAEGQQSPTDYKKLHLLSRNC